MHAEVAGYVAKPDPTRRIGVVGPCFVRRAYGSRDTRAQPRVLGKDGACVDVAAQIQREQIAALVLSQLGIEREGARHGLTRIRAAAGLEIQGSKRAMAPQKRRIDGRGPDKHVLRIVDPSLAQVKLSEVEHCPAEVRAG